VIRPIKKPPYYTTSINPTRTKYEIEALVKSFGAEAVQWTEIYNERFVELKFMLEFDVDGKPFRGVFSFKPRPLYEPKKVRVNGRWTTKGVINWPATYRLLKYYLENKLNYIAWGCVDGFQEMVGHAVMKLPEGGYTTVDQAVKGGVFKNVLPGIQALPEVSEVKPAKSEGEPRKVGAKIVDAEVEEAEG